MKKIIVCFALIVLIALFAAAAFIVLPQDPFTVQSEGVVFHSDGQSPKALVAQLSGEKQFIVSAQVSDPVKPDDTILFNGVALFLVVLNGNGKETVQVVEVLDAGGHPSYCLTNRGDLKTEERVSVEECASMLGSEAKVVVTILSPDSKLVKPAVELSGKRITVKNNSFDSVGSTSFTVLKAMFSNAAEVLAKSNSMTKGLG